MEKFSYSLHSCWTTSMLVIIRLLFLYFTITFHICQTLYFIYIKQNWWLVMKKFRIKPETLYLNKFHLSRVNFGVNFVFLNKKRHPRENSWMSVNVDIIVLINVLRIVMLYELFSSLVWKVLFSLELKTAQYQGFSELKLLINFIKFESIFFK